MYRYNTRKIVLHMVRIITSIFFATLKKSKLLCIVSSKRAVQKNEAFRYAQRLIFRAAIVLLVIQRNALVVFTKETAPTGL